MPAHESVGHPIQHPAGNLTQHARFGAATGDPIIALYTGGVVGGYYPIIPGTNLWKDTAKTIPATIIGDPVRVVAKMAGTYADMIAPSDAARPVIAFQEGRFVLDYDGVDDHFEITGVNAGAGFTYYYRARIDLPGGATEMVLGMFKSDASLVCQIYSTDAAGSDMIPSLLGSLFTVSGHPTTQYVVCVSADAVAVIYRLNGSPTTGELGIFTAPYIATMGVGTRMWNSTDVGPHWDGIIGDFGIIQKIDAPSLTIIEANI
jgi:hypothetical protein